MGILGDLFKLSIGYERKHHSFDSSRLPEGDVKILKNGDMIKNEKGRLVFYRKAPNGYGTGRVLPIKERS